MTYGELFARVGAIVPKPNSFAINVQTLYCEHGWCDPSIETTWSIALLPKEGPALAAREASADAALNAFVALLSTHNITPEDKTGVGALVGGAEVGGK